MKVKLGTIGGLLVAVMLTGATSQCNLDPNVATPNQVVIAINAYNTAVGTGTAYLHLPLCSATVSNPCRTAVLSQQVYTALRAGRSARNTLLADLQSNSSVPVTLIQTLQAAYSVLGSLPTN